MGSCFCNSLQLYGILNVTPIFSTTFADRVDPRTFADMSANGGCLNLDAFLCSIVKLMGKDFYFIFKFFYSLKHSFQACVVEGKSTGLDLGMGVFTKTKR